MAGVAELMTQTLLGVFNQRDAARRAAAAAATYADDVVFTDPEGVVTGPVAIADKAGALLDGAPGFVFAPRAPVRESGGSLGVLAWQFGPDGGEPVVTGTDVAVVQDDRIVRLWTLLDAGPPPG